MRRKKFELKNSTLSILSLMLVFSLGIFSYVSLSDEADSPKAVTVSQEKSSKSGVVVYPRQYSDKNITHNAIIADPKFSKLAIFDRNALLANTVSSLKRSSGSAIYDGPEKGTWLWTPILDITPKYRDSIISGALQNDISNIYLSIDSYLDIFVMEDGEEKRNLKKKFDEIIKDFIAEASKHNITVDAEAGWRNWAEKGNSYKAFAVLEYAMEFNRENKEKFRGFQYDVEPYLLDSYREDKREVLVNFLDLVAESVRRLHGSDLVFTVVIPEFYDGTNNETPSFSYLGKNGFAIDHLLTVLDRREESKIIIMSYRNFSKGDDGTIDISMDEILRANKYKTKIIIAQETGDVPPPYITFHKTSKSHYKKQVEIIEKTFSKEKSYGGIATHYINAFLELR